jgi:hypothetical protein
MLIALAKAAMRRRLCDSDRASLYKSVLKACNDCDYDGHHAFAIDPVLDKLLKQFGFHDY